MFAFLDFVREMDLAAVAVRMVCAVLCGGLIGMEREFKRRPAGFRTHILICLGAAMAILTNLYLYQVMDLYTDIARLGAQVIAGIGFIGAGTIMVTKQQRVKGLTTAAGLWTAAIIGLVCGAGYIECAVFATCMVLLAELVLIRLEYRLARRVTDIRLYIEYAHSACIEPVLQSLKEQQAKINDLEITRLTDENEGHKYGALLSILPGKRHVGQELINGIAAMDGVLTVEEL